MLLEFINLAKVRRAFLYAGIALLVLMFQNLILANIHIFGVTAMIVPIIVVAIGFFESGIWGGVFGLVIGLICDMTMNGSSMLFTVLFPIMGFFSGALTMFVMSRRKTPFFALCACALVITAVCQMFGYLVFTDTEPWHVVLGGALQVAYAIPFVFALYYPCRAVSRLDLSR